MLIGDVVRLGMEGGRKSDLCWECVGSDDVGDGIEVVCLFGKRIGGLGFER